MAITRLMSAGALPSTIGRRRVNSVTICFQRSVSLAGAVDSVVIVATGCHGLLLHRGKNQWMRTEKISIAWLRLKESLASCSTCPILPSGSLFVWFQKWRSSLLGCVSLWKSRGEIWCYMDIILAMRMLLLVAFSSEDFASKNRNAIWRALKFRTSLR